MVDTAKGVRRPAATLPDSLGRLELDFTGPRPAAAIAARAGRRASLRLTPLANSASTTRDFTVRTGGVLVAATAYLPSTPGPWPVAVVLHGGGNSSRADSPPYIFWAQHLADLGFITIAYDKRGNGGSSGSWRTVGFDERAADVSALLDWSEAQPTVMRGRAVLLSVSQGTWVATRVARADSRVGALIQVSGPLATSFEADSYANITSWRRRGLGEGAIRQLSALWSAEVDAIQHPRSTTHWARYRRAVTSARAHAWYDSSGYAPSEPDDWFVEWYGRVSRYDPREDVRLLSIPTLWLYGANDSQLDAATSAGRLRTLVQTSGIAARVHVFPNADHGIFAPVDSLARPLGPTRAAPGLFATTEEFLRQVRAGAALRM
jgi:pimeloyl-ACP methyl ester carboxylesterase